ncbi:MAG: efflux RND transporter permease subunit [Candidatus Hydrogenedentes bacterium]|nr:efflux RND transporter permease subunit [Candidatus Hydrogenedentota bacterium]NLT60528.1 efflux RND transporter permease subunit [Candidatus Hydrogenedentota bacterium]HNZ19305.1 efflux RND transporter permease subunit [Candidatus Hydrogenedentota bacterium]HOH34771.1 efflux RND transporter permease subunit [Candidatus Hydrogenedentota bacterium]
MIVSDVSINRSTTVLVLLLLILVAGVFSYMSLPRESNPEVVIPYITVSVPYEGVAPEDIESLITIPIERRLAGLSGVKEMKSTSVEGLSYIFLEFEPDIDIDDALQKVRDKVDLAEPDIPEEADDPVINEINTAEFPIMIMSLSGGLPLSMLDQIAEDLEDQIETIEGVLDVEVIGGVEREIQIEVDPERVAQYGISFGNLMGVVAQENVNTPGGTMELGEAKFLMRTPGEFKNPDDINDLVVKQSPEGTVFLRDVAKVYDGFKDVETISRLNGEPSVTLTVIKRSGANIIQIADEVQEEIDRMLAKLPKGLAVSVTWNEADYIREIVSELENGILSGMLLVLVVIFVFLGFANAIFVALAIPVSMLITFAVLYMSGVTLNMVVLFSLILALGMLVDNGIVVVENIYRHRMMGLSKIEAAKAGTAEVAWPITTSTLTTVAAFVPFFFWPGIFGEFMYYVPYTVIVALLASLFMGLVVNPALASVFMQVHEGRTMRRITGAGFVMKSYAAALRTALRWRAVTVLSAVGLLVVIATVFFSTAETIFMPITEPPQAYIDIECAEGTNLATSDYYARQVEEMIAPYTPYVESVVTSVGSLGVTPEAGGTTGSSKANHISRVSLDFPELGDCKKLPSEVLRELRDAIQGLSGADIRIEQMDMGPPTGPPINVEISGDDFATLARLAQEIRQEIKDVPGLVDLRDDYNKGKPEVQVVVDRQEAWRMGLSTQLIGLTVQAAINGRKAADFREGDEEYDVTVRFPKAFREDLANINTMNLIATDGRRVPFSSVARIEQGAGLGSIQRIDRKRTVTVSADVHPDFNQQRLLQAVQAKLQDFPLPADYTIDYTGENEDMEETQFFLFKAFVVAVFLIALVLITEFNSLTQPFIILTSVILSLAGVFLGLYIFRMPFGILMSGIGCVSLAGVVVNNAIVLIDYTNQLRARGMELNEAIVTAGVTRFRPVMLTAVTTILGLVPMAVGVSFDFRAMRLIVGGEMSQWWGGMAVAVIFGLTFATLMTLIVVPTLYSAMAGLSHAVGAVEARAETADMPFAEPDAVKETLAEDRV